MRLKLLMLRKSVENSIIIPPASAGEALTPALIPIPHTPPDNDVYALFPTNLAQGMTLVFDEHSVRITSAGKGLTASVGSGETNTN